MEVGRLVLVPTASGKKLPALVTRWKISDEMCKVQYINSEMGGREIEKSLVEACPDFDWCLGLTLSDLCPGETVEARYEHGMCMHAGANLPKSRAHIHTPSQMPFHIWEA